MVFHYGQPLVFAFCDAVDGSTVSAILKSFRGIVSHIIDLCNLIFTNHLGKSSGMFSLCNHNFENFVAMRRYLYWALRDRALCIVQDPGSRVQFP